MSDKSFKTFFPASYRPYVPPPPREQALPASREHMPVEPRKPTPYIADGYYRGDFEDNSTLFAKLRGFVSTVFGIFAGFIVDSLRVLYAVSKTVWKLFASVMIILWKILLIMMLFDFLAGD